jgi:site-specific DNA recombinase
MEGLHKTGPLPTTKRAVLYARVSSDDRGKDGRNLGGQLEMCRRYAQEHGWRVVVELAEDDRGASGASFELPQLNRILEMAQDGEFDVLVVREIDRLSRNLAKQLIVEGELNKAGVEIAYTMAEYPDTPEGRLHKHIRATIAEYEREKIAERMIRGRRQKVKAGSVLVQGNPPYGYRVIEQGNRFALEVDESEARVVRLIFTWYVHGDGKDGPLSMGAIARKLEGTPSYADTHSRSKKKQRAWGKWHTSAVHRILTRETYVGIWHYGKRRRHSDGKKWTRNSDEHRLTVEVPAIMDRETWEAAQARRAENRLLMIRNVKHDYLLLKRLKCGDCGGSMHASSHAYKDRVYLYYRCWTAKHRWESARTCNAPGFRADQVDAVVWEWVKSFLKDPDELARGLEEYQLEQEKAGQPMRQRLSVVNDLLPERPGQRERLLDLSLSGEFSKELLTDRKTRLEETIRALEEERAELISHLDTVTVLTEEQVASLQDFAAAVATALEIVDEDFEAKRRIVEELDVQVTLGVENGQKVVYARCILGDALCPSDTGPQICRERKKKV